MESGGWEPLKDSELNDVMFVRNKNLLKKNKKKTKKKLSDTPGGQKIPTIITTSVCSIASICVEKNTPIVKC